MQLWVSFDKDEILKIKTDTKIRTSICNFESTILEKFSSFQFQEYINILCKCTWITLTLSGSIFVSYSYLCSVIHTNEMTILN